MKTHRLVHSDRSAAGRPHRRSGRRRSLRLWPAALVPALLALLWWWKKKRPQKGFQDGISTGWVQTGGTTQTGGSSGSTADSSSSGG